jgi:macrodomain Ter protein organizer (MatP/YcbG family)
MEGALSVGRYVSCGKYEQQESRWKWHYLLGDMCPAGSMNSRRADGSGIICRAICVLREV